MPVKIKKRKPTMGIMALYIGQKKYLEERRFFAKLIQTARTYGLQAFVFTPEDIRGSQLLVHHYDQGKWVRRLAEFPDVIYDRCRYQNTVRFKQLQQFRKKYANLLYMNRPMANKWIIYQQLRKHPTINAHLPDSALLKSTNDLPPFLKRYKTVYAKPINGTGGRGVLRIEPLKGRIYRLQGRHANRKIMRTRNCSLQTLKTILTRYVKQGNYMIQQGIDIRITKNRVHDYRVLIQKNGNGEWSFTGGAARIGRAGSITSNLHGGGVAASMEKLLEKRFGMSEAKSILHQAEQLSFLIAKELEKRYAAMCELALDLAIDPKGQIWLLETNPKPSREVFARIGKKAVYRKAIQRPVEYAMWLLGHTRTSKYHHVMSPPFR